LNQLKKPLVGNKPKTKCSFTQLVINPQKESSAGANSQINNSISRQEEDVSRTYSSVKGAEMMKPFVAAAINAVTR